MKLPKGAELPSRGRARSLRPSLMVTREATTYYRVVASNGIRCHTGPNRLEFSRPEVRVGCGRVVPATETRKGWVRSGQFWLPLDLGGEPQLKLDAKQNKIITSVQWRETMMAKKKLEAKRVSEPGVKRKRSGVSGKSPRRSPRRSPKRHARGSPRPRNRELGMPPQLELPSSVDAKTPSDPRCNTCGKPARWGSRRYCGRVCAAAAVATKSKDQLKNGLDVIMDGASPVEQGDREWFKG